MGHIQDAINLPMVQQDYDELLYEAEGPRSRRFIDHLVGAWPWRYTPLRTTPTMKAFDDDTDSEVLDSSGAAPARLFGRRRYGYRTVALTILGLACFAGYVIATAPLVASALYARQRFTCGKTVEEARERGCTFDLLTDNWLPPQCSRAGLDEFLAIRDGRSTYSFVEPLGLNKTGPRWRYYVDPNQREEYTDGLEFAPIGGSVYATTLGEHLTHCTFMLIRATEARASGDRLDSLSSKVEHSKHCLLFLLEHALKDPTINTVTSVGDVSLGSC